MEFFRKNGIRLFFFVLILHCVFIYLEMSGLRMITKLLLLPILIIYLTSNQQKDSPRISLLAHFGLLFSFFGDYLLGLSGELFFLTGMIAFMCTHICNSIYFIKLQRKPDNRIGLNIMGITAIILAILIIVVYGQIADNLGEFKMPIQVYMLVIAVMAFLSAGISRKKIYAKLALRTFIPGALLFVSSDAILALNKFLLHSSLWDIPVMVTYALAQYYLVAGFKEIQLMKSN